MVMSLLKLSYIIYQKNYEQLSEEELVSKEFRISLLPCLFESEERSLTLIEMILFAGN